MPRHPRLKLAGVPFHIIQRGHSRAACFFADADYACYLSLLQDLCQEAGVRLHTYVLVTNHVHLSLTPDSADGPSHLMQHVGQRYVQYVNSTYQRTGTFWEGRFRSCLVDAESYLLACQRDIELNPVRAQMVAHPVDYPWSSYRGNAQGAGDGLLSPHVCYQALRRGKAAQQVTYRELFRDNLEGGFLDAMRQAMHVGYCPGSDRFKQEVAAMLKRRGKRGQAGRPNRKEANDTPQGTP